jgi:hypothetical protein
MPRLRLLVIVGAALAVGGCFSKGAVHVYRTEPGRALADPGPDAYVVWADADGWHLRARSDVPRVFHGWIETGRVRGLQAAGTPASAVLTGGGGIAFSFVTDASTGEAGFDWRGSECPEFSIYMDGEPRTLRVFAGAYAASPVRTPFTLCR